MEAEEYKLRVHKNGTKGLLTYRLDEGVRVYWDFAYYEGEGVRRREVMSTLFNTVFLLWLGGRGGTAN